MSSELSIPPPPELAQAIARVQRECRLADPFFYFHHVGSTNDVAARMAERGAPDGAVVIAVSQGAGRGRHGRQWHSPPHAGAYISIVLRPGADAAGAHVTGLLTLAAGVALVDGIARATGFAATLKWPNDVVVERPRTAGRYSGRHRKLAGILAEASLSGSDLQHVILGVGLNLRSSATPPELHDRATSLEDELGRAVNDAEVIAECLIAIGQRRQQLQEGATAKVVDAWRSKAPSARGAQVEWQGPNGPQRGVTYGIDADGALLVYGAACVQRVVAGEVSWL